MMSDRIFCGYLAVAFCIAGLLFIALADPKANTAMNPSAPPAFPLGNYRPGKRALALLLRHPDTIVAGRAAYVLQS